MENPEKPIKKPEKIRKNTKRQKQRERARRLLKALDTMSYKESIKKTKENDSGIEESLQ